MEIQASLYGQDLIASLTFQGAGEGQAFKQGRAAATYGQAGFVFSPPGQGVAASNHFAKAVVDRLNASGLAAEDGQASAGSSLKNALSDAVDYVRDSFGDQAATAMMGIVSKSLAKDAVSEDDLSQGLLSVIKLVDRNFGFQAGDALMAQFNGALNESLNRYFENGFEERFYAVSGPSGSAGALASAMTGTLDALSEKYGAETAKAVGDILTNSLESGGVNRKSLGQALSLASADLVSRLGDETGAQAAKLLSDGFAPVLDMLYPEATAPPTGTLLDMAA